MSLKKSDHKKNASGAVSQLMILFEISMIVLSFIIVLISFGDLVWGFPDSFMKIVRIVDLAVISVFSVDLAVHLYFAKDKKRYLKRSLFTIICVVPFSSFFRLAALFRLNHIFNLFSFSAAAGTGLFSRIWIFFMQPGVARMSKFFNLGKSYYDKNGKPNGH